MQQSPDTAKFGMILGFLLQLVMVIPYMLIEEQE